MLSLADLFVLQLLIIALYLAFIGILSLLQRMVLLIAHDLEDAIERLMELAAILLYILSDSIQRLLESIGDDLVAFGLIVSCELGEHIFLTFILSGLLNEPCIELCEFLFGLIFSLGTGYLCTGFGGVFLIVEHGLLSCFAFGELCEKFLSGFVISLFIVFDDIVLGFLDRYFVFIGQVYFGR